MNPLLPCPSCQRHVRSCETACPFCGVALDLQDSPPPLLPGARLGRAALFAFGASLAGAVAAGCGDSGGPVAVYGAPPAAGAGGGSTTNSGGSAGTGGASGAAGSGGAGGASVDGGADADAGAPVAMYGAPPPTDSGADAADAPGDSGPVPVYGSPPA